MRAACLLVSFATLLAGQVPGQSRLEQMHAPAGQSDQLPPELRKNAPAAVPPVGWGSTCRSLD